MPDGYRITPEPETSEAPEPTPMDCDETSSLSPVSPLIFDGDDPDDAEWNPSCDKSERRRSTFR